MTTFRRSRSGTEWHFLSTCRKWPVEDYDFVYRNIAEGPPESVCPECVVSASDVVRAWPGFTPDGTVSG